MADGSLIKFVLKVLDENTDDLVWEHLCYAPKDLYLQFIRVKGIDRFEMADWISRWAKEDFNIDLPMTTAKDITILRTLILDKYKSVYPHLIRKNNTDRQGWVRVWVSTHMDKELRKR